VTYGQWVGVSVHEVAQVVAAAAPAGHDAATAALVVKLTRVAMLAPLVAGTAVVLRRRRRGHRTTEQSRREPVVPLFVLGFLAMAALRSVGVVPEEVLDGGRLASMLLLTAALFGLGTGVKVRNLRAAAANSLALGAVSTMFAAALGLVGILLVT
jgi:uncharacterized membrane protein YadS